MDLDDLYQAYFKDVYLYLCSLSQNSDIAEEIAQETFFKAINAIDTFDGSKDIRAWLFTIAKNSYFSYCRKNRFYVSDDEALVNTADSSQPIEEKFANEDLAFQVHQYLHQMDEPYKEVFSLRVFGELPFDKIGVLFGKSAGWARVTYYRAKTKILKYLEANENEKNQL